MLESICKASVLGCVLISFQSPPERRESAHHLLLASWDLNHYTIDFWRLLWEALPEELFVKSGNPIPRFLFYLKMLISINLSLRLQQLPSHLTPTVLSQHWLLLRALPVGQLPYIQNALYPASSRYTVTCFKKTQYTPQWLCQFIFPPRVQEDSLFSIPSPAFIVCRFFDDGHSDWCEVISHCSFDLHFSNNELNKDS